MYFLAAASSEHEMMQWVNEIRQDEGVGLVDFELLQVIGEGSFGKVTLVRKYSDRENGTRPVYAMKILHKDRIVRRSEEEQAMTERNIMQKVIQKTIIYP